MTWKRKKHEKQAPPCDKKENKLQYLQLYMTFWVQHVNQYKSMRTTSTE